MSIRIAVGSTNPCKIEAVREAFQSMPMCQSLDIEILSIDADSGQFYFVIYCDFVD